MTPAGGVDPAVSVITPSSGRRAWVLEKLRALEHQGVAPERIELVVVDNACPEGVGDAVDGAISPLSVRVLRSPRRLAAAEARRWAAEAARGRWLWWSDDDVVPDPGALAHHLSAHEAGACVTIGSVRFRSAERAGGEVVRRWRARRAEPAHLTGVNALLPRSAVLGAAVPRLPRPYGGEDTAVGLALERAGLPFVAVPDAWVTHHGAPPDAVGDPGKGFDAGYNAAVLAALHPRVAWPLGVHPLQLAAKTALLAPVPAGRLRGRLRFERAYLDGARAGRRDPAARAAPTSEAPA